MYESGIYQPLSYNEHILPSEVVAMLYRNMEDQLETVRMKSRSPSRPPRYQLQRHAGRDGQRGRGTRSVSSRMEIVKQAEAVATTVDYRLSLNLRPATTSSRSSSVPVSEERRSIWMITASPPSRTGPLRGPL